MRTGRVLSGLVVAAVILVGVAGCSDSPTRGNAPTISNLRVDGALRVSGDIGVVGFSFDYIDPDRDIQHLVFQPAGGGGASSSLSDATEQSGTVTVQQSVTLPAAGTEMLFVVFVIDRRGNHSNQLSGSFVAPD